MGMSKCPVCMKDWANHSNYQEVADHEEIINARLKANTMLLSMEDVKSILLEIEHAYISDVLAREVIQRMIRFRDKYELDR
jgi:hypothetical protein